MTNVRQVALSAFGVVALLLASGSTAMADITFCNGLALDGPDIFFIHDVGDSSCEHGRMNGWFRVAPKNCQKVFVGNTSRKPFHWYAFATDGTEWFSSDGETHEAFLDRVNTQCVEDSARIRWAECFLGNCPPTRRRQWHTHQKVGDSTVTAVR